jgi:enediyne biosynthesis protein E4
MRHLRQVIPLFLISCLLCTGHAGTGVPSRRAALTAAPTVPVTVATALLVPDPARCQGRFVPHKLPFAGGIRLREMITYHSNGSGVTAGDLDGDGDLDLAFAAIDREGAILWNEGDLRFTATPIPARFARSVMAVDVDADGRLDLTFTHRGKEGLTFWRNHGPRPGASTPDFVPTPLPGVTSYAYAQGWADLDGDGDLDLVTASYAAELRQHGVTDPDADPRAGVWLYTRQGDGFVPTLLARRAETLALALVDLSGDDRPEIWTGNDFGLPDHIWTRTPTGWAATAPFARISQNTMSIEWGDLDNDGAVEFFTTDMNPYDISPKNMAAWLPMMNQTEQPLGWGDPQIVANVLQVPTGAGKWANAAGAWGVDATGWSWAAQFGDLDQDGYLDLYIANGMVAQDLFGHLPGGELVEENQAFRNHPATLGGRDFAPAPEWGLGSTAGSRGLLLADLDNDGDLDAVVNTLRATSLVLENQLCTGRSLQVALDWHGSPNPAAIGATLLLESDQGTLRRDVRASGVYLSGPAPWVHFGLPDGAEVRALHILWPDGALSTVPTPPLGARLEVRR